MLERLGIVEEVGSDSRRSNIDPRWADYRKIAAVFPKRIYGLIWLLAVLIPLTLVFLQPLWWPEKLNWYSAKLVVYGIVFGTVVAGLLAFVTALFFIPRGRRWLLSRATGTTLRSANPSISVKAPDLTNNGVIRFALWIFPALAILAAVSIWFFR